MTIGLRLTTLAGCLALAAIVYADDKAAVDAAGKPGQTDLLKLFKSEFVAITPGEGKFPATFTMGSKAGLTQEQPAHTVTLGKPFQIAKYEVTQNLYEAVMGTNPSKWKGPRNSAENFTFADAQKFCRTATELMRAQKLIGAADEIRLPTEAEWEYCCRAGTGTAYSFGDAARKESDEGKKASLLDPYGWHTGNAAGNDPPVGALKPNPWGLYDMHGYLREFVQDQWHPTYEGAPADGSAWVDAPKTDEKAAEIKSVVVRGGSWQDAHDRLRSAARESWEAGQPSDGTGFRCVLTTVKGS